MSSDRSEANVSFDADILIVDDDPAAAQLLVDILGSAGYEVRPASDGALALRSVKAEPPALILLDIKLPTMSGLELCRLLKADPATRPIPVIFVSTLHDDREKGMAFQEGAVDYIVKPIHKQELLARVKTHLAIVGCARELAQERDRAQQFLDIAGVMIVALDADAKVTLINRKGRELLGYEQAEILGQRWFEHYIPARHRVMVEEIFLRIMAGSQGMDDYVESPVLTRRGEERLIAWHTTVLRDTKGGIVGTLSSGMDITERKRLQADLARADRLASMGMLAAGVAHEINNPLAYVLYNVESLGQDLPKVAAAANRCSAALRELVGDAAFARIVGDGADLLRPALLEDAVDRAEEALSGTRRIRDIARGLGTFSRVERVECSRIDLRHAIESAISMAFNEIKYRAQLVKDFGSVPAIWASEGKVAQIFLNLLLNAAHSIDEGNVDGNRIAIRTYAEGGDVLVEVSDTGRGIPPESLARIFEPFFTTDALGRGSGLGLAICRNVVTEFGGDIRVESELGHGTRFLVRLPVTPSAAEATANAAGTQPSQASSTRGRILLVDDEPALRATMKRLLGRDHDLVVAASGKEGQAILANDTAFDLILCDLMMPEMTGMELHAWLAERSPALAAQMVFVTGGAFTPRASDYLARVANLKIEKPFDPSDLKRLVSDLILAAKSKPRTRPDR